MKKRRRIKYKRVIFALFLLITIISTSVTIIYNYQIKDNNIPSEESLVPQEKIYTASLIMAGDNLIHKTIYQEALKNAQGMNKKYDFTPMYEKIRPIIKQYDLAYYNQETIIGGDEIGLSGYPAFNSPYELADDMIKIGFNLVSLATNHTLDRREQAILNSRNYWNHYPNVLAVGSYSSFEERNKIDIREVNNITYTMLNYTYGTNGITVPKGKEYLVNVWPVSSVNKNATEQEVANNKAYQNYKEQVKQDIEKVRAQVDVLIVAMHWGVEYTHTPTAYQKDAAQFLANLGVDIIIGTHPHVIQPIEYIGDTLVIYSLGNFISAHEVINQANRIGLLTGITITKTQTKSETVITLDNLTNELIYTYYDNYTNFQIIPFSQINETHLKNYQEIYQKYKNIVTQYQTNIQVNPIK